VNTGPAPLKGVCAVVLAAGESARFNGIKLLEPVDGMPLVEHAIEAAQAVAEAVWVVTGAHAEQLRPSLQRRAVHELHNPAWALGMGESIGCAFRALRQSASPPRAALVCLADQPRVDAQHLHTLLVRWQHHPDRIVAADHGATLGPPCVFPQRCFETLSSLTGPRGAQPLLRSEADRVIRVALPQAAVDVDTREDLVRLRGQAE